MLKIHQLFLRTYFFIFLAIFITLSVVTYFWSKNIYMNQIEQNLVQNIDTLSVVLKDLDNINNIVEDLKAQINLRITIVDEKGNVIAESHKDKNLMENHSNREEILKSKDYGLGKSIRVSKSLDKELLYVAKKVTIDKNVYYIRMADYTNKITDNFVKLTFQIFSFIIFFLIVSLLATYFIGLRIKDETDTILDFLTDLSNKKSTAFLNSNYTYEFNKIAKLLNKVAIKLSKRDKQKAKQNAKLKLANRQKDEIISAISHEFKNPIAIIQGYCETIHDDKDMPVQIRENFLNKIKVNSHKMTMLIDKLRLTLKLEEGKQELVTTECKIKPLIENAIYDLKQKYKNTNIIIQGEDISLKVDETLFSMAISNLIENALKYSEDDIKVTTYGDEICIVDKGIGIEKNDLDKINQKFYRVSKNGWNNSLGLGLFIVQAILSLHKFELKITSEPNVGSKFCIKY